MSEVLLRIEQPRPGVVDLVLNRPERRNALTVGLMNELVAAIERLSAETENRVLILRGNGPVFCAGLDLVEASDPGFAEAGAEAIGLVLSSLTETPLVTIAVAHGVAAAGGAGLLAACDFAIASEELKIVFPETRRGLVPALVATVLRKKLKDADLRELFFLAEPVDAARARSMGLVSRVVPEGTIRDEANRLADLILKGAPGRSGARRGSWPSWGRRPRASGSGSRGSITSRQSSIRRRGRASPRSSKNVRPTGREEFRPWPPRPPPTPGRTRGPRRESSRSSRPRSCFSRARNGSASPRGSSKADSSTTGSCLTHKSRPRNGRRLRPLLAS